jgi:hypothetical protein
MLPSPAEIRAARTARGGWTKATLKRWGVSWPPTKGWKAKLEQAWYETERKRTNITTISELETTLVSSDITENGSDDTPDLPNLIPLEWYLPD